MITKIIACADVHFKSLRGIDEQKIVFEEFIKQCKEIVAENGAEQTRIVVAGDIFDAKIAVTNESILAVHWFLKELNDVCKTIVIAGNHDLLRDNLTRIDSLTPLFEIGDLPNVVYLDKILDYKSGCLLDDDVVWCDFSIFEDFNPPCVKAEREKYRGKSYKYVGLVHADVTGAITTTNFSTEFGLDPNLFEDCDFVVAGHIHKTQEIKKNGVKIVYCSSIRQKEFGETVTEHGFVLWDVSTPEEPEYEYREVENKEGGYFKFAITEIEDIENDYEELINL